MTHSTGPGDAIPRSPATPVRTVPSWVAPAAGTGPTYGTADQATHDGALLAEDDSPVEPEPAPKPLTGLVIAVVVALLILAAAIVAMVLLNQSPELTPVPVR